MFVWLVPQKNHSFLQPKLQKVLVDAKRAEDAFINEKNYESWFENSGLAVHALMEDDIGSDFTLSFAYIRYHRADEVFNKYDHSLLWCIRYVKTMVDFAMCRLASVPSEHEKVLCHVSLYFAHNSFTHVLQTSKLIEQAIESARFAFLSSKSDEDKRESAKLLAMSCSLMVRCIMDSQHEIDWKEEAKNHSLPLSAVVERMIAKLPEQVQLQIARWLKEAKRVADIDDPDIKRAITEIEGVY